MISLIDVLEEMKNDFNNDLYKSSKVITRHFSLAFGGEINVNLYKIDDLCEVSFLLPIGVKADQLKKLPSWQGMEMHYLIGSDNYLEFKQVKDYDRRIFIQVMQDAVDMVEMSGFEKIVESLMVVLTRWSTFFKRDSQTELSLIEQQGLYGELVFLEQCLKYKNDVISCWTGCSRETHDFHFGNHAIEVKTSSKNGPDIVKVNNEYQLDDSDIEGKLYLVYMKIKRSEADGENLPTIIDRIIHKLSKEWLNEFETKLLNAGYIYKLPDLYTCEFRVRNERFFSVESGFPRLIASDLAKGLGNVEYELGLDACNNFEMSADLFFKGVNE